MAVGLSSSCHGLSQWMGQQRACMLSRRLPCCAARSGGGVLRRSIVVLPGLGNSTTDYQHLANVLRQRGLNVEVAPVKRLDW